MVCGGGLYHGAADTVPDHTQGCARTIIPAHPQVLESGILQRISPEERKRQEVREAWMCPGAQHRHQRPWDTRGSVRVGSRWSWAQLSSWCCCFQDCRTGQCWEGSPAQISGETGSFHGKGKHLHGFSTTECPKTHWDYWYWPGRA